MRVLTLLFVAILLAGCAFKRHGVSFNDEYEQVRVDQTVGNHVRGRILQKTLFCLNPRRETRWAPPITNMVVSYTTNATLAYVTNVTVTVTTNQNRTLATNQLAFNPPPQVSTTETNEPTAVETNQVAFSSTQPIGSTNQSLSKASTVTFSKAPNQTSTTFNFQTLLSSQITSTTNNISVTTADNQNISAETNIVVTTVTNTAITAATNQVLIHTNAVLRDYFLYAELTPPADFTISPGESLVVVVDGVRHGFTQAPTQAALIARRGFTTYSYRVPPQVLVDIANGREVKVRLRGTSSVIERKMSYHSRNSFRHFVLKYFTPETPEETYHANTTILQPGS